jgi:hypothetical protein
MILEMLVANIIYREVLKLLPYIEDTNNYITILRPKEYQRVIETIQPNIIPFAALSNE